MTAFSQGEMPYSTILVERGADARLCPLARADLHAALAAMLDALGYAGRRLEARIIGDGSMEALNIRWMGIPGPTNILSFPAENENDSLGSLVLSAHACQREARLYGQDPQNYCLRLLAHGLAHLLGLDHGPHMNAACETALRAADKIL